jgi:hypothetical protein
MKSAFEHVPESEKDLSNVDWYIYYRVRVELAEKLQARVASMQAQLSKEFGIGGALKRRPTAQEGRHTWMEIYTRVPHHFDAILAAAAAAVDLSELIDGERHAEQFWDVTSCA